MRASGRRLAVLSVLLAALMLVLLGRTVELQAGDAVGEARKAADGRVRTLVDEAPRGVIWDQAGRALASNRQSLQVVADAAVLFDLPADGADVLAAAALALGTTFDDLDARTTFCDSPNAVPGVCWGGAAADPIPLAEDVSLAQALPFVEAPKDYPGLSVRSITVRSYPAPSGANAAHLLGHLGAASPEEVQQGFGDDSLIGRGGLEQQYDAALRGTAGTRTVLVGTTGAAAQTLHSTPTVAGSGVVTSIDADLQAVVEEQLREAVQRAKRSLGPQAGDSGSAVVLDVTDGRVLALASYPDYDPDIWSGGISESDYAGLRESGALLSNPVQGLYPPGSTFKPFTAAAMAKAGFDLSGTYPCPSSYRAGGRSFSNNESRGYGTITLRRALEVSCNTVFYRAADEIWRSTGGQEAAPDAADPIHAAAVDFGLGAATGIDLPGEAAGTVDGRAEKDRLWREMRDEWCASADLGYPELALTDPGEARERTALDRDNCETGGLWRQGNALNASIGQGLTLSTPLQIATAYAAIANGGTRYRPQVAKAVIAPDGSAQEMPAQVLGRLSAEPSTLRFIASAMQGVTREGSASAAFRGFPLDRIPVAGKTGSAQVSGGRPATSWFGSFAPADNPRYAVVFMVTQGGTGAGTSAPSARAVYEALFGIDGSTIDPGRSILTGAAPTEGLPELAPTAAAAADDGAVLTGGGAGR